MIGFAASVGDRTFPSIPTHAIALSPQFQKGDRTFPSIPTHAITESTLKRTDSPCERPNRLDWYRLAVLTAG